MRKEDLEQMEANYRKLSEIERANVPLHIWNINAPSIQKLRSEIFQDFDEKKYGISWWHSYSELGTMRRILISDYLYQCSFSLETNIVEARIHLLSAIHYGDKVFDFYKEALHVKPDLSIELQMPVQKSINGHIEDYLEDMHLSGLFRAIGSIADALSVMIAAVLGLPINLFTCGYGILLAKCRELQKKNQLSEIQKSSLLNITALLEANGWLEWALAYRNMLVHRGRLVQLGSFEWESIFDEQGKQVLDAHQLPKILTKMVSFLPREPDVSEIEVLVDDFKGLALEEDAEETAKGVFKNAVNFAEQVCGELISLWQLRRKDPTLIAQPRKQWPDCNRRSKLSFLGIKPGKKTFDPELLTSHPVRVRRMKAASLLSNDKEKWKNFD